MVQSPVLQTVFRKVRTIFALFLRACKNTCNFACGAAAKFLDMTSVAEPNARLLLEVVEKAIGAISQHLSTKTEEKGSVTDLVRLLQLRQELEAGKAAAGISVRWIR